MRQLIWILWPSFLMAIPATGIYFSLFDPVDLTLFGILIPADRIAAYTIGFFAFWIIGAGSSAMTCLFLPTETDVKKN
jgi:hypothetical protein